MYVLQRSTILVPETRERLGSKHRLRQAGKCRGSLEKVQSTVRASCHISPSPAPWGRSPFFFWPQMRGSSPSRTAFPSSRVETKSNTSPPSPSPPSRVQCTSTPRRRSKVYNKKEKTFLQRVRLPPSLRSISSRRCGHFLFACFARSSVAPGSLFLPVDCSLSLDGPCEIPFPGPKTFIDGCCRVARFFFLMADSLPGKQLRSHYSPSLSGFAAINKSRPLYLCASYIFLPPTVENLLIFQIA